MGFGDYLSSAFPGVRITSSKRDPNSTLGRANPKSFHNVGMAWDVAPIPGMTFDQYKTRVQQDGWNVREAIDEVKNPSKHATGPHWHMAVDGRKEQQPMAGNGLAALMQNNPAIQSPQQFLQQQQQPQTPSLASYLSAPLTNEALQPAQMPQQPSFVDMSPLPGVKPKGRGTANDIMGSIFDALAAIGGGKPTYWASVVGDQQEQRQQDFKQQQLETDGRQKLAELMVKAQQKQAERDAIFQNWQAQQDYKRSNPDPTSAARMAQEAGFQPGTPQYKQAILQYMQRPIMIGGEAYAPTSAPSLPQDYNPDEWEVVE